MVTFTFSNPGVDPASGEFSYYLHKENWSVAGVGRTDGTSDSLIYSPTGDFGGNLPSRDFKGDGADPEPDGDVDQDDFAFLESCFTGADVPVGTGTDCAKADLDRDDDVDATDYVLFQVCMSGPGQAAPPECTGSAPPSGTFVLHGLAVDAIPDGPTLLHARARYYDTKHGRWLQRDPKGYVDGPNLYEAFGGNPLVNVDPYGENWLTAWLMGWSDFGTGTEVSSWEMLKQFSMDTLRHADHRSHVTIDTAVHVVGEVPLTIGDTVVLAVDAGATYCGYPLNAEPLSRFGKYVTSHASHPDRLWPTAKEAALKNTANALALGVPSMVEGFVVYAQTGDEDVLTNQVGAPCLVVVVSFTAPDTAAAAWEFGANNLKSMVHTGTMGETPLNAPGIHSALKRSALAKGQPPGSVLSSGGPQAYDTIPPGLRIVPYLAPRALAPEPGIQLNKAAGDAWERELLMNVLPKTQTAIQPQITIMSSGPSGLRVRLDALGTEIESGLLRLADGKASMTAPLTPNQVKVYPELEVFGGTVVGKGKPPYARGTVIPPTKVDVIRKR